MTLIQLKPSQLKIRRQTVKWIIIHHTAELYKNPALQIDNSQYQMNHIYNGVLELKDVDVNYHFVVDRIKSEYVPIVTRPFVYLCEWPDINENINNRSLHICLVGNYDFKIPSVRLYEILAYRVVNPLIRLFALNPSRIKLHRDVSSEPHLACPGEFFELDRLIAQVRRFVIK